MKKIGKGILAFALGVLLFYVGVRMAAPQGEVLAIIGAGLCVGTFLYVGGGVLGGLLYMTLAVFVLLVLVPLPERYGYPSFIHLVPQARGNPNLLPAAAATLFFIAIVAMIHFLMKRKVFDSKK